MINTKNESLEDISDRQIRAEIEKLPLIKRSKFAKLFMDRLYDRDWCDTQNIDYKNPNLDEVRRRLYHEAKSEGFFNSSTQ